MKLTIIDPELNLHQLPAFIITAFSGIILAAILTAQVWPLAPQVISDYTTINYVAFEILKLPCAIIAVTLSLLIIIGTMHRSAQTVRQIKIATKQNDISNYYKHLDEFRTYVLANEKLIKAYENNSIKRIHDKIWANYLNNNYNIEIISEIQDKYENIFNVIIQEEHTLQDCEEWEDSLNRMIELFCFDHYKSPKAIDGPNHLSNYTRDISKLFIVVLSFELDVKSEIKLKQVNKIAAHIASKGDIKTWLRAK
ncbi:hypothetical protein HWV01_11115 [Moritella sp. 5]|uniref:hypothetical protein n=1 Tax=Moritella sp. 5 TaxID=2746231 RepID=UPI001BA532E1|nr:hypothetical protein [Moritella sp. 5]QUM80785.1 hypothetical protein HWV01_11085 [Moritella sp. 5]QUM80791.1 hypothetical protein HWV01_11115 [Moritella sp. 5]